MAKEKEEKVVKQPEVSKLHVMELVQYMARPLKALEEQFRVHCEDYRREIELQDKHKRLVEASLLEAKNESKRLEGEVQRAKNEARKVAGEVTKNFNFDEQIENFKKEIALLKDEVIFIDQMKGKQKELEREVLMLSRGINGCVQSIEKMKEHNNEVERNIKDKQELNNLQIKSLRRDIEEFKKEAEENKSLMRKEMEEVFLDIQRRQKNINNNVNSNMVNVKNEFSEFAVSVEKEMKRVEENTQSIIDRAMDKILKMEEDAEAFNLSRKDIHILERRVDKIVGVIKEMKAHFEFEV